MVSGRFGRSIAAMVVCFGMLPMLALAAEEQNEPQDSSSGNNSVTCSSDGMENYKTGARINFKVEVPGFYEYKGANTTREQELTAPADVSFKIDGSDDNHYFGHFDGNTWTKAGENEKFAGAEVLPDKQYFIRKEDIRCFGKTDQSWSHGLLVVPFKFFSDDHSLESESTIGYYVGRSWSSWGMNATAVISAGLGSISVATTNDDGEATTTERPAFSVAAGLLFRVLDGSNFEFGVFLGRDYVKTDDEFAYEHDGETWLSLSFGYDFSR